MFRWLRSNPPPPPPDPIPIEAAMVDLARAHLDIQATAVESLDTKGMGLIGLNAALVAATIAAKDLLSGHPWWVPLPGLAISIVFALVATWPYQFDTGPEPRDFYNRFGGAPPAVALAQLFVDLGEARLRNDPPLGRKGSMLKAALYTFAGTGVVSTAVWLCS